MEVKDKRWILNRTVLCELLIMIAGGFNDLHTNSSIFPSEGISYYPLEFCQGKLQETPRANDFHCNTRDNCPNTKRGYSNTLKNEFSLTDFVGYKEGQIVINCLANSFSSNTKWWNLLNIDLPQWGLSRNSGNDLYSMTVLWRCIMHMTGVFRTVMIF